MQSGTKSTLPCETSLPQIGGSGSRLAVAVIVIWWCLLTCTRPSSLPASNCVGWIKPHPNPHRNIFTLLCHGTGERIRCFKLGNIQTNWSSGFTSTLSHSCHLHGIQRTGSGRFVGLSCCVGARVFFTRPQLLGR